MADSKEKIYDEQINPLMGQIIDICNQHKIAMVADFNLGDDLHCMTALLSDEYGPSESQLEAWEALKPTKPAHAVAITTETKPDGKQHITIRGIS